MTTDFIITDRMASIWVQQMFGFLLDASHLSPWGLAFLPPIRAQGRFFDHIDGPQSLQRLGKTVGPKGSMWLHVRCLGLLWGPCIDYMAT